MHKNAITGATTTATQANPITKIPIAPTPTITKRIGGTTYQISVHLSQTSNETMSDKISRMIKNESVIGKAANQ